MIRISNNIICRIIMLTMLLMGQHCFSQEVSAKKALSEANPDRSVNMQKFDSTQSAKLALESQININSNNQKQFTNLSADKPVKQSAKAVMESNGVTNSGITLPTAPKPVAKRKRHSAFAADSTSR